MKDHRQGILAVIPARGGSKGVPRKNVRLLGGKPLIAHSIIAALNASSISRVVMSTDDEEIAAVAQEYGAEVPFLRPAELAQDHIPVMPVIQDLARKLDPNGTEYPIIVVLQPTNPFKSSSDIDRALAMMASGDCDTVLSVSPSTQHPYRMRWLERDGDFLRPLFENVDIYAQRQELPDVYNYNGSILVCRQEVMLKQTVFYGETHRGLILDELAGFDIDTELDFLVAEQLAAKHPERLPSACRW